MSEFAADERPEASRRETGRSSVPDASERSLHKRKSFKKLKELKEHQMTVRVRYLLLVAAREPLRIVAGESSGRDAIRDR
jgi:hypothetical protein